MKTKWLFICLLLLIAAGCKKEHMNPNGGDPTKPTKPVTPVTGPLALAKVFQNNMVVQRDKPFVIWGTAPAKLNITANTSWNSTTFNAVADTAGMWKITIPAGSANSAAQTITVAASGQKTILVTNVLIGDVWICSGQSNMVYPVDSIAPFEGVLNYKAEIAAANYPQVRMLTVPYDGESAPVADFKSAVSWDICSPATISNVSAVAYYFAQYLNTTLNVPIGIIIAADNGSYCQQWTNLAVIKNDPVLASNYQTSSDLYNGMINPLINLSVKGFTWYQGENNQHDSPVSNYTRLNSALIQGWRTLFNQGQLPFYYVQLTPFAEDYNSTTPPGGDLTSDYLALFREAQANIRIVAGTGMVVTMDVGEADNHHPRNKKPVGERLALLALNHTYGQNVQCVGPQYASFTTTGNSATISFMPGTTNGLNTINNSPLNQYFFVAGIDKVFRQAHAVISGSTIVVTAPPGMALSIKAVRYAFTNAPITNLQNSAGLPAEPFRTDNW